MKQLFTNVKSFFLLLSFIVTTTHSVAQNVGVNATGATPDVSAILDVANANKGLLIPRVSLVSTTDAATIATPATSLLVYNTNATMTNGQGLGYYYNSGTTVAPLWIKLSAANEAWLLRGNTSINDPAIPATYGSSTIGTNENFLGTTDANDVVIGTDNIERFRIKQTTGNVGIGTAAPAHKLDILAPGNSLGLRILSGNTNQLSYLSLGRTTEYAQIGAATTGTFFTDAQTGDMAVKNFNSGKLLLGASYFGAADMSILPNGNVGVHTVTPGTIFDVKGNNNWNTATGEGDVRIGDPTYRLKIGVANGGGGAGDIRITAGGGTNRIFLGGSTNTTTISIDGLTNRVGIKDVILPNSGLDVGGDIALREGPAIVLPAATTFPVITLTGNEYSHYRLTGATIPFSLYSITGGNDGQILTLINTTGQFMTLYNWNVANGIITGTGANIVLNTSQYSSVTMVYNATLARWIVTSYSGVNGEDWHTTGNAATNDPNVPAIYGTSLINGTENWAGTTDANDYVIGTNTIERLRVKQTTGDVGIGTASPSYRLHIVDPTAAAISTYSENTYVGNSSGYGVYGVSNNNPGYGYGGFFTGGFRGVQGVATTAGAGNRHGGYFTGWYGEAINYGSYNYGYGGTTAYGIYATSGGGSTQSIGAFIDGTEYGVIVPNGGGNSGFGTTAPEQRLSVSQGANIDQSDLNAGTTALALTFGSGSGEGIGSKRTAGAGTNQFGLDFYQGFANRMRIWNDGNIVIGQNSAASLAPNNTGLGNPNLTISNPSTVSQTSDIPVFTAKHSGSSGTTWQMGSIEYYTEGEANIGFTYQLCPLNSNTTTNLGGTSSNKYLSYRWNQLYCSVAPNVSSDINLKKDIKSVDYGIHQLRKIQPISYKFKVDFAGTDKEVPDAEKRTHIGFNAQEIKQVIPEIVSSWDYITNNEDGYIKAKTPTLGMVYEEMIPVAVNAIKQLDKQQQQIIKTISISDFGMEQSKGNEIRVNYTKEFKDKLQGNPIVTVTALEPNASYYIASIDADGFIIKNNNSSNSMSFNWIAMAKISEQKFEIPTDYTEEQHTKKLKEIEAFEASLPSNEEAIKMVKAKSDSKQQKQTSFLTDEQQKLKDEAEKIRSTTKTLEAQREAENKKELERIEKERLEKL
jgi:hypothetical protein